MREWWCKQRGDTMGLEWDIFYERTTIEQVFFDLGRVWAYESKPGEPAGRWTYCGAQRKIDAPAGYKL